jgi:hypothetical protein
MNTINEKHKELLTLLEALCEDRITASGANRLEDIIMGDEEARTVYMQYIDLHGTLHWDAANGSNCAIVETEKPIPRKQETAETPAPVRSRRVSRRVVGVAVLSCVLLVFGILLRNTLLSVDETQTENDRIANNSGEPGNSIFSKNNSKSSIDPVPITLPHAPGNSNNSTAVTELTPRSDGESRIPSDTFSSADTVSFINERILESWNLEGIQASAQTEDSEWIRRVYLDIVGHIPSAEVVDSFLTNTNPQKRELLIDELLGDLDYVRNWTTVWTNLLIGRSPSRNVDRPALEKFLRDGFVQNRPWNEVAADLVSAEGAADENGASTFLLAHLNNQAVPATAIVSRLFLGIQVQCTQCHDHPFNDWKQNQFWEFNSIFKQTAQVQQKRKDSKTGKMVAKTELATRRVGGEIYYENRRGVMQIAYPFFEGVRINPDANTNRRQELATLMSAGDKPQIAVAMVNRMWAHFFGYGFTRPIDDIGPHNTPSHPELLNRLAREFVKSDYDLKQLIRWICNSDAYQLTSRFNDTNRFDDPDKGNPPLFSRMYVKQMTAEQLYDSLLIATKADHVGQSDWAGVSKKRQRWLQQFVIAFGTDENDETTTFDGTVPQALLMMNSRLVQDAVSDKRGTYFHEVVQDSRSQRKIVQKLCLSALSRYPTKEELDSVLDLLRRRIGRDRNRPAARIAALQDVFWAFLNSNEFILVH